MEESIKRILSKFRNGEERFNTSPLFRAVVSSLLRGSDPISLLDTLIERSDESLAAKISDHTERIIVNTPHPSIEYLDPVNVVPKCRCKGFFTCSYCLLKY
jgi:hypothetical protein